ncbi:aromatic-ring-hydroxylating dioxygenase subunit beta [Zavarzinia sp. CC-PAN008]|uniref:aromatic-ring-hydroxylating dioxygenase subunit beta n=1 Tax=Zavarzinia sp. CC-PAN008 TaxID=3243332 RepID=UPI003F7430C7
MPAPEAQTEQDAMRRAALLTAVQAFIHHEARLADTHAYDAWEALWTDDAVYWVPANGDGGDPEVEMSIIYDNRSRIALRVRQLQSGRRFSQMPPSRLVRLVSNVMLLDERQGDVIATANVLIFESSPRDDTLWAARVEYRLRPHEGPGPAFRMAGKTVILANNDKALYTLSFLV